MKAVSVELLDPENAAGSGTVLLEAGASWKEATNAVMAKGRVVAAPFSYHTSLNSYIASGGFGLLARQLGLVVDNIISFQIVLPDGRIAECSRHKVMFRDEVDGYTEANDTSLFWALHGGGAATYGIVTKWKLKLQIPPFRLTSLYCVASLKAPQAQRTLRHLFNILSTFPPDWTGHYIMDGDRDHLIVFLVQYAPVEKQNPDSFTDLHQYLLSRNANCTGPVAKPASDTVILHYPDIEELSYVSNTLLQYDSVTPQMADAVLKVVTHPPVEHTAVACYTRILGGEVSQVHTGASSVNPLLRTALASLSCTLTWSGVKKPMYSHFVKWGESVARKVHLLGRGVYGQEASYSLSSWGSNLWGMHYEDLLHVKSFWDPENFLYCHHCVGAEFVDKWCPLEEDQQYIGNGQDDGPDINTMANEQPDQTYKSVPTQHAKNYCTRFCLPGTSCWPSDGAWAKLQASIRGIFVKPGDEEYSGALPRTLPMYTYQPAIIIYPSIVSDVQKVMQFTRKYRIRLSVLSESSQFIDTSSAEAGILLDLLHMNGIKYNTDDRGSDTGESVVLEAGNTWEKVYKEMDKAGRLVVGGGNNKAAISHFITAGEFSPLSRKFGLGIDNVLSLELVLPDGRLAECAHNGTTIVFDERMTSFSENNELFWAVRGGGGETFGILTRVTMKLHRPPDMFRNLYCTVFFQSHSLAERIIEKYLSILSELSRNWSGDLFIENYLHPAESGAIFINLLHYGVVKNTSMYYDLVVFAENLNSEGHSCVYTNFTKFWPFKRTSMRLYDANGYPVNGLFQFGASIPKLSSVLLNPGGQAIGGEMGSYCVVSALGGKINQVPETSSSVNIRLRTALASVACGYHWNSTVNIRYIKSTTNLGAKIRDVTSGAYYGEAQTELTDWQTVFWGENYDRLLGIKKRWDYDNVLYCHQCVGSERFQNFYCSKSLTIVQRSNPTRLIPKCKDSWSETLLNMTSEKDGDGLKPTVSGMNFDAKTSTGKAKFCRRFCVPGLPCWPTLEDIWAFGASLERKGGAVVMPIDANYTGSFTPRNIRFKSRTPGMIVYPRSTRDVQKAVLFARKHNLRVTMLSSDHDFMGKSTAHGSFQINLSRMRGVRVTQNDDSPTGSSVTAEAGVKLWGLFHTVADAGKFIVAGSWKGVALGGHIPGGGISPASRVLGLAVDSVIRLQVVLSDGSIATAYPDHTELVHPNDATSQEHPGDLLWAIKGGGGGTFGVVTRYTMSLHEPPHGFVYLHCTITRNVAGALDTFRMKLPTLPREWGGYYTIVTSDKGNGVAQYLTVSLVHWGNWSSPTVSGVHDLRQLWSENCQTGMFTDFPKLIDELNKEEDSPSREYAANTLIQYDSLTPLMTRILGYEAKLHVSRQSSIRCTGTITGGKIREIALDSAAISPEFRTSVTSMSCRMLWKDASLDKEMLSSFREYGRKISSLGRGAYAQQTEYSRAGWQREFWGVNYRRLLRIKKLYDPHTIFYVPEGVGSEIMELETVKSEGTDGTQKDQPLPPKMLAEKDDFVSSFCFPGHNCWPKTSDILELRSALKGRLLLPYDNGYADAVRMRTEWLTTSPAMVAFVENVRDIQLCLAFVRKFGLRVSVISSGHSYIGRSTARGSVQISVKKLRQVTVNPVDSRSDTGGSVTVGAGTPWKMIYDKLDRAGFVVQGGSAHTVSVSGYTMGGGHGPLSRVLGLAVDNVIEVQIVLADGRIVRTSKAGSWITDPYGNVTSSGDADLLWAVRGGGGGTFGILTKITFKLYQPPPQLVQLSCAWAVQFDREYVKSFKPVLKDVVEFLYRVLPPLSKRWAGGHIKIGVKDDPLMSSGATVRVHLNILHFGSWKESRMREVDPIRSFMVERQEFCRLINRTTFYDYEKGLREKEYTRGYIMNAILQEEDLHTKLFNFLLDLVVPEKMRESLGKIVITFLGGRVNEGNSNETSINPEFRNSLFSTTVHLTWKDPKLDSQNIAEARNYSRQYANMTSGVMHFNEASYDVDNWPDAFWGEENYERLLLLKKTYDPGNVFHCRQCVGQEFVRVGPSKPRKEKKTVAPEAEPKAKPQVKVTTVMPKDSTSLDPSIAAALLLGHCNYLILISSILALTYTQLPLPL